jgi:type 1 glutamine amidotransferase
MGARNLILSGGVGHPFQDTSGRLRDLLASDGIESEISTDVNGALEALGPASPGAGPTFDLVTLNALRWQMGADRYAPLRGQWAFTLSDGARRGLQAHLEAGGGLLGMHTASICFDDWSEWGGILGGRWNWNRSAHPPVGPARVKVTSTADPLTDGLDGFETFDEIYGFLDVEPDVEGLLSSAHGGVDHPVLWRRVVDGARVVYDALGHDLRAYDSQVHCTIVRRAAKWAATCR